MGPFELRWSKEGEFAEALARGTTDPQRIEAALVDLRLLLMAINAGDPVGELRIRTEDIIRRLARLTPVEDE